MLGISSTGIMRIYLLGSGGLIKRNESVKKVIASSIIVVTASIVSKVVAQRRVGQLLRKKIDLVQEQNLVKALN